MFFQRVKHVTGCTQVARNLYNGDYTFEGDGFAQFDVGSLSFGLKKVELSFATLEKDGLIFLGVDPPQVINGIEVQEPIINFYSLEIKDGYLISKFDLGNGYMEVKHEKAGNVADGKKHVFEMKSKSKKFIRFWLDKGVERLNDVDLTSDQNESKTKITEIYIGGMPMREYLPHP